MRRVYGLKPASSLEASISTDDGYVNDDDDDADDADDCRLSTVDC